MNRDIKRGDIFYITDNPNKPETGAEIWANRPGLIVSNNVLNKTSQVVQIVFLSTSNRKKPSPTHTNVTSGNKTAMALCEQIHTVDKSRLTDYIGSATPEEMNGVDEAMLFALQINHGKNPQGIFKKYEKQVTKYPSLLQTV